MLRVARYSARAPVAESRLRYDAERAEFLAALNVTALEQRSWCAA